ncbi:unnamed protein product [Trifolium pratense]|uniref:Uncharacterized protein n=1 Tax=Trifolium pratense TaxID=57577 RepID=A0ACB0KT32_TRIPR|nr:unnamed protein product [Trifolium pratense]
MHSLFFKPNSGKLSLTNGKSFSTVPKNSPPPPLIAQKRSSPIDFLSIIIAKGFGVVAVLNLLLCIFLLRIVKNERRQLLRLSREETISSMLSWYKYKNVRNTI